jgi:hypothetical protein
MARNRNTGSPTKEFPIDRIDATLRLITPGMTYSELRDRARVHTHVDIPGVLRKRFLLVGQDQVEDDLFLSVANAEGLGSLRVRKIMYFLWMYRSAPHRRFVCEIVADRNGHWRTNNLTRKANFSFFQNFYSESTAIKARSNFEYFLTEVGIYRPLDNSVHLELDDGWLPDAVAVAAQHEGDRDRRQAMLANPVEFLISNGLHGLANASPSELREMSPNTPLDAAPMEDEEIDFDEPRRASSRRWNRTAPNPASRRVAVHSRDPVQIERATLAHYRLELLLSQSAVEQGYEPRENRHIDMYFVTSTASTVLAEIKSCHRNNLHAQVRRGISQLLEYRFVYRHVLGTDTTPVLVLEMQPPRDKRWLVEYTQTLDILIAWRDPFADRLVTGGPVPAALNGVVTPT